MPDTVTREEFKTLENRVQVLEGDSDGEKRVTRYILDQVRHNGDDLGLLKSRMDRVETEMRGLKNEMSQFRSDLTQLRKELPTIVADTMREVLRETRR